MRAALTEGWPLLVTYATIGIAYGVIARQAGLSVAEASASSFIIFAGSAQFAAVELLRAGESGPAVVLTVLLINARYLLIAAAFRRFLTGVPLTRRVGIAYLLTDESFAMAVGRSRRGHRDLTYYVTFATGLWIAWNAATLVGAVLGAGVPDPGRWGIDFAITASFLAIVVLGVRHRSDATVAVLAAVLAVGLRLAGAPALGVVAAGAIAPLVVVARHRP